MKPALTLSLLLLAYCGNLRSQPEVLQQLARHLPAKKDTALVNALNRLSWGYRRIDTEKSLHYGKRAADLSQQLHYSPGLAYSYKNRGTAYSVKGDFVNSRTHLEKALLQFSELRNRAETGNVYNLLGLLFWEHGKSDSAFTCYRNALKLYREIGDEEGKGIIYCNIGILLYENGNYDDALGFYTKALTIAEKRRDRPTLASVHTNIGLIYTAISNHRKALIHHRKSIQFEDITENRSGMARSYTNLGVCHYHLNDKDSSLFFHQKALKLYQSVGEQRGVAHSLLNIGSLYLERDEYHSANNYLTRALAIKRQISDKLGEVIALDFLGKLRIAENRQEEAAQLLEEAYKKASEIKSLHYQVETSLALSQLYDRMGSRDEAMHYYKIHSAANDSLLREKASNKLTGLQIGLATKEKQREVDHWKTRESRADKRAWAAVSGGLVILVLIGLSVRRLRRRHSREKLRLETELEKNRLELLAYTRRLIEKSPVPPEEIAEKPETDLKSALTEKDVATLHTLSTARIITDDDWDEFKKRFVSVYPHFMTHLKRQFRTITPAELRLSALIALQLSTKEIAAMLGISADSVKKSRQRLRKKLELAPAEDLEDFISKMTN